MDNSEVTFKTRGEHTVTLQAEEFIRRFLMHVLPKGFVKIRHFGLKSSTNAETKLEQARKIIEAEQSDAVGQTTDEHSNEAVGIEQLPAPVETDRTLCPCCKVGRMIRSRIPKTMSFRIGKNAEDTS